MCPLYSSTGYNRTGIAQSAYRLATVWTVRGMNPCGGEIFRRRPDWLCGLSSFVHNGHTVFPRAKAAGPYR